MQEDTCRGDGLNLYAYCANNPVMYYDPSGRNGVSCNTNTDAEENAQQENVTVKEEKETSGYQSDGRMSDDLLLYPKTNTKRTENVTEWRREIKKSDIAIERIKFVGEDAVKVARGVWRSIDGTRQFRVVPEDYFGEHAIGRPKVYNVPHVHFEFLGLPNPGGIKLRVIKNIHVPLVD